MRVSLSTITSEDITSADFAERVATARVVKNIETLERIILGLKYCFLDVFVEKG